MASGLGGNTYSTWAKSKKGFYHVELSKMYDNMTDLDIELKMSYTQDLLSKYLRIPEDMLTLHKKKSTISSTGIDEVYYVQQGVFVLGKVSVGVKYLGSNTRLIIVYQRRDRQGRSSTKARKNSTVKNRKARGRINNRKINSSKRERSTY